MFSIVPMLHLPAPVAPKKRRRLTAWLRVALLALWVLLAVYLVTALAWADVKRRYAESLKDFAAEQVSLARSLAVDLGSRLDAVRHKALCAAELRRRVEHDVPVVRPPLRLPDASVDMHISRAGAPPPPPHPGALIAALDLEEGLRADLTVSLAALLPGMRASEKPGTRAIFIQTPGARTFESLSHKPVPSELFARAIAEGRSSVEVPAALAEALGLHRQGAIAGFARHNAGPLGDWHVVVVASALRERSREIEQSWRSLLTVLVATGAVLLLGAVALYWQRQELRAQQALAVEAERRSREAELERASRAATLGTLAMGITHELSTPLGIIGVRAEQLVRKVAGDERAERSVRAIQDQTIRMSQIIRGLLGLVRGQSPVAESLAPLSVARAAVSLVEHRFTKAEVRLRLDASASLPLLRGDQRLLEHALVNLLLNACDACAAGGQVVLHVSARAQHICFTVTDSGAGIAPEIAARALEPFFTTKPEGQGSGLGLAVASEIVKSHHGTLRLAPLAEGGTCAEIEIPLPDESQP